MAPLVVPAQLYNKKLGADMVSHFACKGGHKNGGLLFLEDRLKLGE
jgi:hypothetical protein